MFGRLNMPLVHRNKRRARLYLYLMPAVFLVATTGVILAAYFLSRERPDWWRNYHRHESIALFRDYVRIDTAYPTGNEIPAAEFLARELARLGLRPHVERIGHRNANVWAILEGSENDALVLHNHLDADAIERIDMWRYPPYGGVIELPFVVGRGTFDMKSVTIAQLLAFKELAEGVRPPRRSVVFLGTGDEERGSQLGLRWFLREHPDLVDRFAAVLTEGGAVEAQSLEEIKHWGTEVLQKRFVHVSVCSSNRGALEALYADFKVPFYDDDRWLAPELPPQIVEILRDYAKTRARDDISFYFEDTVDGGGGAIFLPPYLRSMIHDEVVATRVARDPEGGYRLNLYLFLLPWTEHEEALERALPGGLSGYTFHVEPSVPPVSDPDLDGPVFDAIDEVMAEAYPGTPHGPLLIPRSITDARFFRAAGIPSYGFSPFLVLTSDSHKITGPNEHMPVPAFLDGVELYTSLVQRLAR